MSAMMKTELKDLPDPMYVSSSLFVEDEVSTSAGSSDNELVPAGGDDETRNHTQLSTEVADAVLAIYGVFSIILCGAAIQDLLNLQMWSHHFCNPLPPRQAYAQPQVKKASRSHAAKALTRQHQKGHTVQPPPGIMLPPPGLSPVECSSSNASHGQPRLQDIGPPPGLEPFSRPPGLFDYTQATVMNSCSKQPKDVEPQRRKRAAKNALLQQALQQANTRAVEPKEPSPAAVLEFDQATYRKELSAVLRDLANGSNVAACVKRIRAQNVPRERQAAEFADILTRAAEENRGSVRRLSFAFAVGLSAGEPNSAFAREECEQGLKSFFEDVEDLAAEVPRLRNKLANELVPTVRSVFSEELVSSLADIL